MQVTTTHRVNYSEVDQMGVVYHANYLVWLDVARCELLRQAGMSYRELEEERGFFLAVSEARVRYRKAARYDDLLRIRCWVREAGSRKVGFGYAIEHAERNELLATAVVELVSLSKAFTPTRLPPELLTMLPVLPDPVRVD
ncbi:MAG: acyl-CoA thioesterase [Gemmatimonadetes bacterium]|nr:acyl-CoA thioesterase [Gemmatimonadota bacterium]